MRDEHTMCPCNGAYLCHTCHAHLTGHTFEARDEGYFISRHEPEPFAHPIRSWTGDLIMLDCEGGYVLAPTPKEQAT